MSRPKKVAIIGAGPSGLVAAKTLLHNFPKGTFSPTIFEKSNEIGGLWPIDPPATTEGGKTRSARDGFLDPSMRTNLSRFTVAFSDLAWESAINGPDIPMFPQAWQVGRYLGKYVERYIPEEVLRLGHKVVGSVRESGLGSSPSWTVQWVLERSDLVDGCSTESSTYQKIESESFNYLIVASGYFSRPYTPDIPGLSSFAEKTFHSSAVHTKEDIHHLLKKCGAAIRGSGKLVIIGGSMSGVETASALALWLSDSYDSFGGYEVHHICTRPFWIMPTYLPHIVPQDETQQRSVQFLPLDLVLYDLDRCPPGPVRYNSGPVSPQQIVKVNEYFLSLLGKEYAGSGNISANLSDGTSDIQPSWVAIGDDYAGYVQSGSIHLRIGRVCAVQCPQSGLATIDINRPDGEIASLSDVVAIITATGFTPFASLSFLPKDVLSKVEYSAEDPFFPLILDGKGTSHAEIPDIGFVGFYRGPYWGVMEMQARSLAETWYRADTEQGLRFSMEELEAKAYERQTVRDYRHINPNSRSQFPMGDYVGLMESFARDFEIPRAQLAEAEERSGPVVPARYMTKGQRKPLMLAESQLAMASLQDTLSPGSDAASIGLTTAIFRALHGTWNFVRTSSRYDAEVSGKAILSPQYPTHSTKEKIYECNEVKKMDGAGRSTYYLRNHGEVQIFVEYDDLGIDLDAVPQQSHGLKLMGSPCLEDGESWHEEYVVRAIGCIDHPWDRGFRYEYVFRLEGVAISSWECSMEYRKTRNCEISDEVAEWVKTVYGR
ncbi:hypothetical protein BBP40_008614 [Aspergillus hancockii]|nr:hypothetical protein BBP40_008614 [Aspergillus hancockii]